MPTSVIWGGGLTFNMLALTFANLPLPLLQADLIHWKNYAGNPVLPLPVSECPCHDGGVCTCWDGAHRRPRSIFQYKDYWYMIYEGTARHPDKNGGCFGDTVGLSRSKNLEGPFTERHPLQVMIVRVSQIQHFAVQGFKMVATYFV